jgi:hypothetical protein
MMNHCYATPGIVYQIPAQRVNTSRGGILQQRTGALPRTNVFICFTRYRMPDSTVRCMIVFFTRLFPELSEDFPSKILAFWF